jgi:hypothetical protein
MAEIPLIAELPLYPLRSDSASIFADKGDAWNAAMPQFRLDLLALYELTAAAAGAPGMTATSATPLTIGTGAQSMTVEIDRNFAKGQELVIADSATPTNRMIATVTDYNSSNGTLDVSVSKTQGSGTFSSWIVTLTIAYPLDNLAEAKPPINVSGSAVTAGDNVALNDDGTVSPIAPSPVGPNASVTFPQSAGSRLSALKQVFVPAVNKTVYIYLQTIASVGIWAVVCDSSSGTPQYGTTVQISSSALGYEWDFDVCVVDGEAKVAVTFKDTTASNAGKAIIGSITDNDISFGGATTFTSAVQNNCCSFDKAAGSVLVSYYDGTNGTSKVGNVSGTAISFPGSAWPFNSSSTTKDLNSSYNDQYGKTVIAYRDDPQSDEGRAIVATVTGNDVGYGTEKVFATGIIVRINIGYSSKLGKHLITYQENSSSYGKAVVAEISGDNLLTGTAETFNAGNTGNGGRLDYDPDADKFLIVYADNSNSSYGTAILASITSGTTVNVETEDTFRSAGISAFEVSYDPSSGLMLVTTGRNSGTDGGEALTYSTGASNVSRWFGIAKNDANVGEGCSVATLGEHSNDQTGLVPGTTYWVDANGDLVSTDTGRKVGLAFSTTGILITEANAA